MFPIDLVTSCPSYRGNLVRSKALLQGTQQIRALPQGTQQISTNTIILDEGIFMTKTDWIFRW